MTEPVFVASKRAGVRARCARPAEAGRGMVPAPGTLPNRPRADQLPGSAGMLCTTLADMAGSKHGSAAEVRGLLAWKPGAVDVAILERSCKLQQRYQLSFWDALMVSAAKATGSGYL